MRVNGTLIDSLLNVEGALNYWQNIGWVFGWARLLLNEYCKYFMLQEIFCKVNECGWNLLSNIISVEW